MRYIPEVLKNHLEANTTTFAKCMKIERKDQIMFGFTEHDQDIFFENILYKSNAGLKTSAIHTSLSGNDSIEAAFIQSNEIKKSELLGGLWDHAKYSFFIVNYNDLSQGFVLLKTGYFGKIQSNDDQFFVELHGTTRILKNQIGQIYSPYCRVEFGSAKCGVNLEKYIVFGQLTSFLEEATSVYDICDQTRHEDDGYFDGGILTWITGNNKGLQFRIKKYEKKRGKLTFFLPQTGKLNISDEYSLVPGCSKALAMCRDRYSNAQNFRGEPFIPGGINGRKR